MSSITISGTPSDEEKKIIGYNDFVAEETSTSLDEATTALNDSLSQSLQTGQDIFAGSAQSAVGVSPYAAGSAIGDYNANSAQSSAAAYDSMSARGDASYQTEAAKLAVKKQIADQQVQMAKSQQSSQFWGSVIGGLGAMAIFSSEEDKKNVTGEDNPRVNYTESEVPQHVYDNFANTLSNSKSLFTRVPGTPGYVDSNIEAGTIAEDLEKDPIGQSIVNVDENGVKSLDPLKSIGALFGSLGDAHEKINVLARALMSKEFPASQSDESKDGEESEKETSEPKKDSIKQDVQDISETHPETAAEAARVSAVVSEELAKTLDSTYAEEEKKEAVAEDKIDSQLSKQQDINDRMQQEQLAYQQQLKDIQKKYPSQTISQIESNMDASQKMMRGFAIMLGSVSQGMTGSAQNPGLVAYQNSMKNLQATYQRNYEQSIKMAQAQHGLTMDGLNSQYQISKDYVNMIGGQINRMKSALQNNLSQVKDKYTAQVASINAYGSIGKLTLQQQILQSQAGEAEVKYRAALSQAGTNNNTILADFGGKTHFLQVKDPKSAPAVRKSLSNIDSQLDMYNKMATAVSKHQGVAEIADRLRGFAFGPGSTPGQYKGDEKTFKEDYIPHWTSVERPENNVGVLIQTKIQELKKEKINLLKQNTQPIDIGNASKITSDSEDFDEDFDEDYSSEGEPDNSEQLSQDPSKFKLSALDRSAVSLISNLVGN